MSKRSVLLIVFTLTTVLTVRFAVSAQSADPWFGTWKQNLARSTYSPGPTPTGPGGIRKEEPWEGGLKSTQGPEGQPARLEVIAKFDGKDYPVKGAAAANTTRAYTHINDRTVEYVTKVDGKVLTTVRTVVSTDGKTSTTTVTGQNAQGQTVNNTIVWDRQ